MAICDDKKFWSEGEPEENYSYSCPCLDSYADNEACTYQCNINVFKAHDWFADTKRHLSMGEWVRQDLRPDDCLDAYALRERRNRPDTELICFTKGREQ